ncbi:MAG: hypothetical protein ACOY6K_12840, partial [Pseudomonadota bacterium]
MHQSKHSKFPPVRYPLGIGADFSAYPLCGKRSCFQALRGKAPFWTVLIALVAAGTVSAAARDIVPLPKPRPSAAPGPVERAATPANDESAPEAESPEAAPAA